MGNPLREFSLQLSQPLKPRIVEVSEEKACFTFLCNDCPSRAIWRETYGRPLGWLGANVDQLILILTHFYYQLDRLSPSWKYERKKKECLLFFQPYTVAVWRHAEKES